MISSAESRAAHFLDRSQLGLRAKGFSRQIQPLLLKDGGGRKAAAASMALGAHENEQQEDYLWRCNAGRGRHRYNHSSVG
jgi:hypothetical protein